MCFFFFFQILVAIILTFELSMLKYGVYLPEKPVCFSGGKIGSVKEMQQPKQAEQLSVAMEVFENH